MTFWRITFFVCLAIFAGILIWGCHGEANVNTDVRPFSPENAPQDAATSQPTNVNVDKGGTAIVAPSAETVQTETGQSGIGNTSIAIVGGSGLLLWIVFSLLADMQETKRTEMLVKVIELYAQRHCCCCKQA